MSQVNKLKLPKLIKLNPISSDKPFILVMGPVGSRSGYGEHARDIVRSLLNNNSGKYTIKIINLNWGMTPSNVLKEGVDDDILNCIVTDTQFLQNIKPDVFIHITIPTEFVNIGKYNIGVTAGIETSIAKPEWIDALNRMDKIVVPSEFTKNVFISSIFDRVDNNTKQVVGNLKVEKPIDVLFEGTDTNTYYPISADDYAKLTNSSVKKKLDLIKEDYLFLVVGHWLNGDFGQDRKDIGSSIKLFLDVFKQKKRFSTNRKYKIPGLVIKTSSATFSIKDRDSILQKINTIRNGVLLEKDDVMPNIYLLHGDLSDVEMNELYNHPKVKTMYSLTKGEGYGRPLQEFAFVGKPVIASNWSGHLDFIKPEYHTLIPGNVTQIHPSAGGEFTLPESGWFTVDYNAAGQSLVDSFMKYNNFKVNAENGLKFLNDEKTLTKMATDINELVDNIINGTNNSVEVKTLELPKLNLPKLNLPELNK